MLSSTRPPLPYQKELHDGRYRRTPVASHPIRFAVQITSLHEAIDELVAEHVDKLKEASPSIPRGLIEQLAISRADGSARCKCGVYRHLFVKKTA